MGSGSRSRFTFTEICGLNSLPSHPLTPQPRPPILDRPLSSRLMASKKQIEANRLNAQKSTGPSSAEGKVPSSMNALKTGIDAKTHLIRGETSTALQELTGEYHGRFRPSTPEQRMLVDTLIDCEWLLRRFRPIQTPLWERAVDIY